MGNFKSLDNKRVQAFIDWGLVSARDLMRREGYAHPYSPLDLHYYGWQALKVEVRGAEDHRYDQDFDAAAAEHYLYIRFVAGQTGDPACYSAPALYAAKKVFDQITGRLQEGRAQSGHPVLPANPGIVAWGHRGVKDGLADYKTSTGGAPYKTGSAIEVLGSFVFSPTTAKKLGTYATRAAQYGTGGKPKPR